MDGRESSRRRRQLSYKISGLSRLLAISSIQSLVLLVFPRPSKGSVWESTQTHVGAGTRALLGPRASASRRRALRGAAQSGADVVSRFPLLGPEARCGALRTQSGALRGGAIWVVKGDLNLFIAQQLVFGQAPQYFIHSDPLHVSSSYDSRFYSLRTYPSPSGGARIRSRAQTGLGWVVRVVDRDPGAPSL